MNPENRLGVHLLA
jgi:tetratricopeptide (TPR) repeat protein